MQANTSGSEELMEHWHPTGPAARMLGISSDTLKRYAKPDGFLVDGDHWRSGAYKNSPRVWNIPACQEAIRWHGRAGTRIKPQT